VGDAGGPFCARCGLPLVSTAVAEEPTALQERARKIKPQYAEGPLVRVAGAANQPEAEFIQGLLLEEGVPSTLRRAAGFDVPDFLAAGPRDILVAVSGAEVAREVLLQADLGAKVATGGRGAVTRPVPLALVLIGALALLAVVVALAL
jgi:hypothetical protein